jgi:hypothetical protein
MCERVLPCFFCCNFCMDICSVDSDEAMKRGDEALNISLLQFLSIVKRLIASSLRSLLSVKCFIAVNFYRKTSFNASSPLLLKRNSSLNASSPLLFRVTLPTSATYPVQSLFKNHSENLSYRTCTTFWHILPNSWHQGGSNHY